MTGCFQERQKTIFANCDRFGSLLDHFFSTFGTPLEHFWITFGPLVYTWVPIGRQSRVLSIFCWFLSAIGVHFWTTFSPKNSYFTKKCIPKACFLRIVVLIEFWCDFWWIFDTLEPWQHQFYSRVAPKSTKSQSWCQSFPGTGFGSHFGSLLPFFGLTLADFRHLMAILALPLRHVDFLYFLDGLLNPPQGHRTAKV